MDTNELIKKRYSPLVFSEQEINDDLLMEFLEAARWAPSAYNEQPWRFIIFKRNEVEGYSILYESLDDANKEWAKTSPVLMLILAKKTFTHNGQPNYYHMYDTGMAVENFILSALIKGIYIHQMGGFDSSLVRQKLSISDEYTIISIAAIGYPGNINILPEHLKERASKPRNRKKVEELLIKK